MPSNTVMASASKLSHSLRSAKLGASLQHKQRSARRRIRRPAGSGQGRRRRWRQSSLLPGNLHVNLPCNAWRRAKVLVRVNARIGQLPGQLQRAHAVHISQEGVCAPLQQQLCHQGPAGAEDGGERSGGQQEGVA